MKAMLPVFCRPLGYVILVLSLFIPFLLVMKGMVTDSNLLFYKECTKLLMMLGALMILMALTKNESHETERVRVSAMRYSVFLTILILFGGMLYRLALGNLVSVDTSSFLTFLIINVLCLEYGIKKATIDKFFKR
ncbi:hypothetical protein [uncultured Bacteroides sp.]|uniref:hypothetical protein n=1 Tax=uncultured Bacteroides sp. TaxID=162156 RepID=UPI002AA8EC0B|nr:hypothetical protein [uncultured Bacteroides sp.]